MIVVLGAGIVGLMTAYSLAKSGHHVTVVDHEKSPALGCSYSNAGIIAVGHANAWAAPSAIPDLVKAVLGRNSAIKISQIPDAALLKWGTAFLANCTGKANKRNSQKMERLSLFSRATLQEIEQLEDIKYMQQHKGTIYVYRDRKMFDIRRKTFFEQSSRKGYFQTLSVDEIVKMEPAMQGIADKIIGGFLSTADSSGDCHKFSTDLTHILKDKYKVDFRFSEKITGLNQANDRIISVQTTSGNIDCDGVVVALGTGSSGVLNSIGVSPLIYPVKGYAATYSINNHEKVPSISFLDESELIACSRFGNRIRLTGIAEFDRGFSRSIPGRYDVLDNYAKSTFGDAVDIENGDYWTGSRPSTPSGPPYLGAIKGKRNIWINAGHGQLGWTMAAGCGELLSNLIKGETPLITGVSVQENWLEGI